MCVLLLSVGALYTLRKIEARRKFGFRVEVNIHAGAEFLPWRTLTSSGRGPSRRSRNGWPK